MRIAVIGTGHIGSTLARHFVAANHEVAVSNSRGPESLGELVGELGPLARALSAAEAAEFGELAVVSVPLVRYRSVPTAGLDGKVVIDTMNYYPARDGQIAELDSDQTTSSEMLAAHLSRSRVVKAFNTINWERLRDGGRPAGSTDRIALAYSGDDVAAKPIVGLLIDEIGFDGVDVGSLAVGGRRQQPGGPLFTADLSADELRQLAMS